MKITIYTVTDCQFSKQEKEYLTSHSLQFEERNLETNKEWLTEMLAVSNNFAGTPVTKIEKDDGQIAVLKGFTQEEFDKALGFGTPAPEAAAPVTQSVPVAPAPAMEATQPSMPQPPVVSPAVEPAMPVPTTQAPETPVANAPVDLPPLPQVDTPPAMPEAPAPMPPAVPEVPTAPVAPVEAVQAPPAPANPAVAPQAAPQNEQLNSLLQNLQTKAAVPDQSQTPAAPAPGTPQIPDFH